MQIFTQLKQIVDSVQSSSKLDAAIFVGDQVISSCKLTKKQVQTILDDKDKAWQIIRQSNYVIAIKGSKQSTKVVLPIMDVACSTLINSAIEAYDFDHFVKGLIDEDLSEEMISALSKQFKVKDDTYTLLLIKSDSKSNDIKKVADRLVDRDLVFIYNNDLVGVIYFGDKPSIFAKELFDGISSELMIPCDIGYSKSFDQFNSLPIAFRQSEEALNIGQIFRTTTNIYGYGQKKMTRLIYNMPKELMKDFMDDYPGVQNLTQEDTVTIEEFLKCNLNMAEAARNLYVHRNTLIYRIEKIKKETGLDIQNIEDALVMKMLILIKAAYTLK